MYRRRSGIGHIVRKIIAVIIVVFVIAAAVTAFLWWNGRFLPQWIKWREAVMAEDGNGTLPVESVVLRKKTLVVYYDGKQVYKSDEKDIVQDVLWIDGDNDGEKEVFALIWSKNKGGTFVQSLCGEDKAGYQQYIYVFDGAKSGMNELFRTAALGIRAASWKNDDKNRIIIDETAGKQSVWKWTGEEMSGG